MLSHRGKEIMSERKERVKALIRRNLSEIIQKEFTGSKYGLISINEVEVNSDYSFVKVYISFLGVKYPLKALEELNKARGYIRSLLAKSLDIYKTPEITFSLDKTFERLEQIENALKK